MTCLQGVTMDPPGVRTPPPPPRGWSTVTTLILREDMVNNFTRPPTDLPGLNGAFRGAQSGYPYDIWAQTRCPDPKVWVPYHATGPSGPFGGVLGGQYLGPSEAPKGG